MRPILYLSITLNIIFLVLGLYSVIRRHNLKSEVVDNKQVLYDIRTSQFDIYKKDSSDIIFLGNSITEYCEWSELFENFHVKNRGIRFDDSRGILKRVSQLGSPAKIFIMIGTNDLGKIPSEETISNYQKVIDQLKSSKIYIESVLPRYDNLKDSVPPLNEKIKSLAIKNKLPYIDLYSSFSADYISADHLHVNAKGYLKIKELLSPLIR